MPDAFAPGHVVAIGARAIIPVIVTVTVGGALGIRGARKVVFALV